MEVLTLFYFLRVPLFVLFALGTLPFLLLRPLRRIGKNIIIELKPRQIGVLAVLHVWTAAVAASLGNLVLLHGGERFVWATGGTPDVWTSPWVVYASWTLVVGSAVAAIAGMFEIVRHAQGGPAKGVLGALGGAFLAFLVLASIIGGYKQFFADGNAYPPLLQPISPSVASSEFSSFTDPLFRPLAPLARIPGFGDGAMLYPGHLFALILGLGSIFAYGIFVLWKYVAVLSLQAAPREVRADPQIRNPFDRVVLGTWVPTYGYVVVLLLIFASVFSFLTFLFDRYRFPVVLVVAVAGWLAARQRRDHEFETFVRPGNSLSFRRTPYDALCGGSAPGDTLRVVAVAAAGGGIQAAAWTTRVLTGIEEALDSEEYRLGAEWRKAFRVASGVSGGSVGLYHYLDCWTPAPDHDRKERLREACEASRTSSLAAVGWGLAGPDLLRVVLPEWLRRLLMGFLTFRMAAAFSRAIGLQLGRMAYVDRGWALEQTLVNRSPQPNATLDDWARAGGASGRRPEVLFNTTVAETGKPMVFTTSRFLMHSADADSAGGLNFSALSTDGQSPGAQNWIRDARVGTAVRLSAAFPYVSPASRGDSDDIAAHTTHLVDGGYFDNHGLVSLTRWLDEALSHRQPGKPGENPGPRVEVLILRVIAIPSVGNYEARKPSGWPSQILFPLSTLYGVALGSQDSRMDERLAQFENFWNLRGHNAHVTQHTIEFDVESKTGEGPPLNWRLSSAEQQAIDKAWTLKAGEHVQTIADFLRGADGAEVRPKPLHTKGALSA